MAQAHAQPIDLAGAVQLALQSHPSIQAKRMAGIKSEFEALSFAKLIEENQTAYSIIDGMVNGFIGGFQRMIAEGKSFAETMKDIFKDMVNVILSEIGRILAVSAVKTLLTAVLGVSTGGGGIIAGIAGTAMGNFTADPVPVPTQGNNSIIIDELRQLRKAVWESQAAPRKTTIDWRKGSLSSAVSNDLRYAQALTI